MPVLLSLLLLGCSSVTMSRNEPDKPAGRELSEAERGRMLLGNEDDEYKLCDLHNNHCAVVSCTTALQKRSCAYFGDEALLSNYLKAKELEADQAKNSDSKCLKDGVFEDCLRMHARSCVHGGPKPKDCVVVKKKILADPRVECGSSDKAKKCYIQGTRKAVERTEMTKYQFDDYWWVESKNRSCVACIAEKPGQEPWVQYFLSSSKNEKTLKEIRGE